MSLSFMKSGNFSNKLKVINHVTVGFLTLLASASILLISSQTQKEQSYSPDSHAQEIDFTTIPANDRARGMVYDGLERSPDCPHGFKLHAASQALGKVLCTHGPDPAPEGVDITKPVNPAQVKSAHTKVLGASVTCDGDGKSGKRVQLIYVHASNVKDTYDKNLATFQQIAADADQIFNYSAAETGGGRHIRFVHDANCVPTVEDVTLSPQGDDSMDNTIKELVKQGYNSIDRKYMIFAEASVICGLGTIPVDDIVSSNNLSNRIAGYARTDVKCWGGDYSAHELMHTLGAVQNSAPHSTGAGHCYDEYDRMCYAENGFAVKYLCSDSSHENRFDCNHDDYFSTNPPAGSYLATHWNTALSDFLIPAPMPPPLPTSTPTPTRTPTPTPKPIVTPTPTPTPVQSSTLAAPTNLHVSEVGTDHIFLSWNYTFPTNPTPTVCFKVAWPLWDKPGQTMSYTGIMGPSICGIL